MQRTTTDVIQFGYELCGEAADEMTISRDCSGEVTETERNLSD